MTQVGLDEAIDQLVSTGEKDPLTIARKIIERNNKHWLRAQLEAYAEDFVSDMARHRLGAIRRVSEIALRPGDQKTTGELKLASVWIPNVGYKPFGRVTVDDLRAKAAFYDKLAFASVRRSQWCVEVASMMEAEGAETLGNLKAALPLLPEQAELEAVA